MALHDPSCRTNSASDYCVAQKTDCHQLYSCTILLHERVIGILVPRPPPRFYLAAVLHGCEIKSGRRPGNEGTPPQYSLTSIVSKGMLIPTSPKRSPSFSTAVGAESSFGSIYYGTHSLV